MCRACRGKRACHGSCVSFGRTNHVVRPTHEAAAEKFERNIQKRLSALQSKFLELLFERGTQGVRRESSDLLELSDVFFVSSGPRHVDGVRLLEALRSGERVTVSQHETASDEIHADQQLPGSVMFSWGSNLPISR